MSKQGYFDSKENILRLKQGKRTIIWDIPKSKKLDYLSGMEGVLVVFTE